MGVIRQIAGVGATLARTFPAPRCSPQPKSNGGICPFCHPEAKAAGVEGSRTAARTRSRLRAEGPNRYKIKQPVLVLETAERSFVAAAARCRRISFGCRDSKPVPASLAQSCPRSFAALALTRFGQDDKIRSRRLLRSRTSSNRRLRSFTSPALLRERSPRRAAMRRVRVQDYADSASLPLSRFNR